MNHPDMSDGYEGLPVHALGLFTFFVGAWPYDPDRPLVLTAGTNVWFWMHVAQVVICAALACWAFVRLAGVSRRRSVQGLH
jgi:hypothetical protein